MEHHIYQSQFGVDDRSRRKINCVGAWHAIFITCMAAVCSHLGATLHRLYL